MNDDDDIYEIQIQRDEDTVRNLFSIPQIQEAMDSAGVTDPEQRRKLIDKLRSL